MPQSLHAGELLPALRTVAIMTAFNEGDVIHHAIGALVEEGVEVYLIDNCSTDDTAARASSWLGRGLRHIERFPDDAGFSERSRHEYVWRDILTRVEQVAGEIEADWFIFVNADEFRESPWPDLDLGQAVAFVDALGYNAINFELLDFQPIDDDFVPGTDVREHILRYERGESFNTLQIKAWRPPAGVRAEVAATGGHDIRFAGRRLCPIPFILRHYGLRGETHGRRKVFEERMPRFAAEERAGGWHVQYDAYASGRQQFLRDPESLTAYDRARVCAELLARGSRALLLADAVHGLDAAATPLDSAAAARWAGRILGEPAEATVGPINDALRVVGEIARGGEPARAHAQPSVLAAARLLASEHATQGDLVGARRFREVLAELADGPQREASAGGAALDARGFVTVALLDELLEQPELLRAYASVFGPADDATLVIWGPGEQVAPLLADLGLDGDDSPDMLSLSLAPVEAEVVLSRHASAVLSERADGPVASIPRFGVKDCGRLHDLALGLSASDRATTS